MLAQKLKYRKFPYNKFYLCMQYIINTCLISYALLESKVYKIIMTDSSEK